MFRLLSLTISEVDVVRFVSSVQRLWVNVVRTEESWSSMVEYGRVWSSMVEATNECGVRIQIRTVGHFTSGRRANLCSAWTYLEPLRVIYCKLRFRGH